MTHLLVYLAFLLIAGCIGSMVILLMEAFDQWRAAARQSMEAVPSIRWHRRTSFPAVDHD